MLTMTNAQSKLMKPSPNIVIQTRNVRSLPLHLLEIANTQAHVQLLQETESPEYTLTNTRNTLRSFNKMIKHGNTRNIAHDGSRRGRRVATIASTPTQLISDPPPIYDKNYDYLTMTGRWQEFFVPMEDGNGGIHVANVYGYSGASSIADAKRANEVLLAAAVLRSMDYKRSPYFIFGDINVQPDQSQVLAQAFRIGILHDLAAEWADDGQPTPTFCRDSVMQGMTGSGTTRIDVALANDTGAAMVTDLSYDWDEAAGFDHVPTRVTLCADAVHYVHYLLAKSRPTNLGDVKQHKWTYHDKQVLYRSVWKNFHQEYYEAIHQKRPQAAHTTWCMAMQAYLTQIQSEGARTPETRRYPPKEHTMPLVQTTVGTIFDQHYMTESNAAVLHARKLIGYCKRLLGYIKQCTRLGWRQEQDAIMQRYTQQVQEFCDNDQHRDLYSDDELLNMIKEAKQRARVKAQQQRNDDRRQLRQKLSDGKTGVADTCKYIKGGFMAPTTVLKDPMTGRPTTDPQRLQEIFLDFFTPVYHVHRRAPPDWQDFIQEFGTCVKPQPDAPRGPPNPQMLYEQAQRASPNSAPAMDDVRPAELALLPLEAWEHRHELLKVC